MKRVLGLITTSYTIDSGNLDEANNKLQFTNSLGQYFDGNIGADKSVSGNAVSLGFNMNYSPPSGR